MKTVKQLADEFGIPKHRVKYQVEKLEENYRRILQGILHVTDDGAAILRDLLVEKTGEKTGEFSEEFVHLLIANHQRELEAKNQQISDLVNQNAILTNALVTEQALHVGTMKHLTVKKSFWDRFKKRP